jgi:hypothetical protein
MLGYLGKTDLISNEILISETKSYPCNLALIINTGWFFYYDKIFSSFIKKVKEEKPESRYSGSVDPGISQIHKNKEIPNLRIIYSSSKENQENNTLEEEINPFTFLNRIIYKSIQLSFIQKYLSKISIYSGEEE